MLFRTSGFSSREEFFREFATEASNRDYNMVGRDLLEARIFAPARALGITNEELIDAYIAAKEEELQRLATGRYFMDAKFNSLMNLVHDLRLFDAPFPEQLQRRLGPIVDAEAQSLISSGRITGEDIDQLIAEFRLGLPPDFDARKAANEITGAENAIDIYIHYGNAINPIPAIKKLKGAQKFDSTLEDKIRSTAIAMLASEDSVDVLKEVGFERQSDEVYGQSLVAFVGYNKLDASKKLLGLDSQVNIPSHMALIINTQLQTDTVSFEGKDEALALLQLRASDSSSTSRDMAKTALTKIVSERMKTDTVYAWYGYSDSLGLGFLSGRSKTKAYIAGELVALYKKMFEDFNETDLVGGAGALVRSAINSKDYAGAFHLASQVARSPETIYIHPFNERAYNIAEERRGILDRDRIVRGKTHETVEDLDKLGKELLTLEKLFGERLAYKIGNEVYAVARELQRNRSPAILQYFCSLVLKYQELHQASPRNMLVREVNLDAIASSLARSRRDIQTKAIPPGSKREIMDIYADTYQILFGSPIEEHHESTARETKTDEIRRESPYRRPLSEPRIPPQPPKPKEPAKVVVYFGGKNFPDATQGDWAKERLRGIPGSLEIITAEISEANQTRTYAGVLVDPENYSGVRQNSVAQSAIQVIELRGNYGKVIRQKIERANLVFVERYGKAYIHSKGRIQTLAEYQLIAVEKALAPLIQASSASKPS
ncbi:hypothetical protein HYY71_04490 [Candidatus Woesearchaeota archaeon]|nr:hypothetical protein [Candidatus Woesearchaeota archaeon]